MEAQLIVPAAAIPLRRPLLYSRLTIEAATVVVAVMTRAVRFGIESLRVWQRRDLGFKSR